MEGNQLSRCSRKKSEQNWIFSLLEGSGQQGLKGRGEGRNGIVSLASLSKKKEGKRRVGSQNHFKKVSKVPFFVSVPRTVSFVFVIREKNGF